MSNLDHAFRRLQAANPEPSPSALVASIQSRQTGPHPEGREQMTDVMTRTDPEQAPPRWTLAVAAAVAVVAMVAVGPLVVGGGNEFASMTDAEVASAFIAGDVDRPSDLFADSAVIEHRFIPDGEVDGWYEWRRAVGETISHVDCVGDGEVACTFTFQLEAAAVQDLGPYPFNSASFTFEDGSITRWADLTNPNDAARDVWNPFFAWLAPELHERMYRVTATGQIQPILTPTAIELWETQMASYIAELTD